MHSYQYNINKYKYHQVRVSRFVLCKCHVSRGPILKAPSYMLKHVAIHAGFMMHVATYV